MRFKDATESLASDGRAEVFKTRREFTDGLSAECLKALHVDRLSRGASRSISKNKTEQGDLFAPYPVKPGYQLTNTSHAAAKDLIRSGRAVTLRDKVLNALSRAALTADEVANELGETVLAIRPRLTELAKMELIVDTGARRENESGKKATVWRKR